MPNRILRRTSYGRWGKPLAFIIVAFAIGVILTHIQNSNLDTIYKGQLEACERGNILREETNRRITVQQKDTDALRSFLASATKARRAAFERDGNITDKQAADKYQKLREELRTVKFHAVPIVDCDKVVPKP